MGKQDSMKAQQEFGDAINSGNLDRLRDVVASDVVDHDPAPDQAPGAEGYIEYFSKLRDAFPDLEVTPDQIVANEDEVAMAYTITGTQRGQFHGIPATGRHIDARGVQIARYRDGKMVERWGSSDQLGILRQLGAAPQPGD